MLLNSHPEPSGVEGACPERGSLLDRARFIRRPGADTLIKSACRVRESQEDTS